jgi:hypothetical protein
MSDESKLAEIRAKREALRAEREAAFPAADPLAVEMAQLADEETIFAIEKEFGKVGAGCAFRKTADGRLIAVKKPPPGVYQKFYDTKEPNANTIRELVTACRAYPKDPAAFGSILDSYEAIVDKLAGDALRLCGFDPKA